MFRAISNKVFVPAVKMSPLIAWLHCNGALLPPAATIIITYSTATAPQRIQSNGWVQSQPCLTHVLPRQERKWTGKETFGGKIRRKKTDPKTESLSHLIHFFLSPADKPSDESMCRCENLIVFQSQVAEKLKDLVQNNILFLSTPQSILQTLESATASCLIYLKPVIWEKVLFRHIFKLCKCIFVQ